MDRGRASVGASPQHILGAGWYLHYCLRAWAKHGTSLMNTVLYTSADVRRAIIDLFSSPARQRVAISAFVGAGAEAYLPRPSGLRLYCWPKAGGTNPNALRRLMKGGVLVFFVDSLHMKLYWAQ